MTRSHRIDWDDLRFALAVATEGSVAAAARAMSVNHSTVLRRIGAFEKRLGVRLFDRLPTGYVLTAGGEELIASARRMDETVTALERKLAGRDLHLSGTLRVTTADTLAGSILPKIVAGFRAANPGIVVELAVSNAMFNLTKRDADVALRPGVDPPETLIGRRICNVAFAVYASPAYLARVRPARGALDRHTWLAPDDSLGETQLSRWLRSALPSAQVALYADSLLALRDAAATGLGVAALPCYLGDSSAGLVRAHPPIPEITTELWVLTHADLRRTARVRAFVEFASHALAAQRPLLEGRAGGQRAVEL